MGEVTDEAKRAREIAHQHGRWQDDDGDTCETTADDDCVSPEEEHHCGSCDSAVAVALAYGSERERAALGRAADLCETYRDRCHATQRSAETETPPNHVISEPWRFRFLAARWLGEQVRALAVPAEATPRDCKGSPCGKEVDSVAWMYSDLNGWARVGETAFCSETCRLRAFHEGSVIGWLYWKAGEPRNRPNAPPPTDPQPEATPQGEATGPVVLCKRCGDEAGKRRECGPWYPEKRPCSKCGAETALVARKERR